jgi:CrcB protein
MRPLDVMWVNLGGGDGSLVRWWIGKVVGEHDRGDFPPGTFLINISGAFVIAYLSVLFKVDWQDRYGTPLNTGVLTGVLGGYTTFSSMQLGASDLGIWAQKAAVHLPRSISSCRSSSACWPRCSGRRWLAHRARKNSS